MKKAALLVFAVILVFQVSATDTSYKQLKNLYEKDPSQCLVIAKKYIKLYPEKSSPYYFAATIFKDKVDRSKNIRGKYYHMNKAIGYALKFDELDDSEISEKVNWDSESVKLKRAAERVIDALKASEFAELGTRLESKLSTFEVDETNYVAEIESNTIETEIETIAIETTTSSAVPEVVSTSRLFYGMPSGTEIVKSHNRSSEQEMLRLINAERKRLDMQPLVWEEDLAKACRYHAFDLGSQGYFNHDSYDRVGGKLVKVGGTFSRIKKFYTASFVNSENIAAGNESAEGTYQQWYHSKGHYDNMFNKASKKVGIGVVRVPGSTSYDYNWVFCTALD